MPRPPDNYTHAQFEPIDSGHTGETVQCTHCRNWTGSIKTLNRKKAHLLNCTQYKQWRAAGNGQDMAPPNKYARRESGMMSWDDRGDSGDASGYTSSPYTQHQPHNSPMVARGRNLDLSKYFNEFWDDSASQKCMRVRCLSCGFVRAKNTTRQVEHLGTCELFKSSPEGAAAVANGELEMAPGGNRNYTGGTDIWRGGAPNPNLLVSGTPLTTPLNRQMATNSRLPPPPRQTPSLVAHLLNIHSEKVTKATQQPFLSHAGCGTLSGPALKTWLVQNGHISRALISAIGALIAKVRLPDVGYTRADTSFRALDLLISTITNIRKEIDFIENTKNKYNLVTVSEPPSPMTKAYMDLLTSVSAPQADLLEGMVALWATEHAYCASWNYAGTFTSTVTPAANYSVPSYLSAPMDPFSSGIGSTRPGAADNSYITALHDCMIPNWTSRDFSKFVDACRSIVDEIASKESIGDGKNQLMRCETLYQQTLFLWERIWPVVNGMGEEHGLKDGNASQNSVQQEDSSAAGPSGTNDAGPGPEKRDINEIQDNGEEDVDSPYGGTGLGAVAAANQSV